LFSYFTLNNKKERLMPQIAQTFVQKVIGFNQYGGGENRLYQDENEKFTVALRSLTQIPGLLDLMRQVRKDFAQEVYLNVNGVAELIEE
jgi:hypothetical protein